MGESLDADAHGGNVQCVVVEEAVRMLSNKKSGM